MQNIFNRIKSIYDNEGLSLNVYKSYRGEKGAGFYLEKNNLRVGGVSIGEMEINLLCKIVKKLKSKYTYNIGVAFGVSTLSFALASENNFVIAIDNFSENNQGDPNYVKNIASKVLSTLNNVNLFIGVSPVDNEICLNNIDTKLSIVFIDGEHTDEAATLDFRGTIPYIDEKSVIIWHDIDKIPKTFENEILYTSFFDTKIKLSTWGRIGIYLNSSHNKSLLNLLNNYHE